MATNNKTLTLSINGVDTAIRNVAQLKATVAQLEQELDGADLGSEQFNKLTNELQASQKALESLQTATAKTGQGANAAGANAKKMGGDFKGAFGIASLAAGDTGQALQSLTGGFNSVKGGIETVKGGFGSLKAAIASTGIGILLIAFGFLVTYLTKSQEGMNFLERKTAALRAVFQVLTNTAIAIGKAIFDAFSNPKKSLQDLVSFIETNLLNRLKSFSVILDGIVNKDFSKVTDGFIQMGTGIENATAKVKGFNASINAAAAAGEALAVSNQNIAREESKLNVERANSRARIAELKLITDDATKSLKVRTEAAKTSFEIEKGLIDKTLKLEDQKIANLKAEQKLKGQYTNEDRTALAETLTKRAEVQKESLEKQAELTAKLSGFTQQQLAADQAAIAKKTAAEVKAAAVTKSLREKALADSTAAHVVEADVQKRALELEVAAATKGSQELLILLRRQKQLETDITLQAIDDRIKKAGPKEAEALLKQRTAVEKSSNAALLKITGDFEQERRVTQAQEEADLSAVKVLGLRKGSAEYLQALQDQVTAELFVELSKLPKTAENEAIRTKIVLEAEEKRKGIRADAANETKKLTSGDLETDFLTKVLGLKGEQLDATKKALSDTLYYASDALNTFLIQGAEARAQALEAQSKEIDDAKAAAQEAADALTNQLNDSQGRIDELEDKLLNTRGEARDRVIKQLEVERQRHQQLATQKTKEDERIKKAENDKIALERKKQDEQKKSVEQQKLGMLVTQSATAAEAVYAAIKAVSKGSEVPFPGNIVAIVAALAAVGAAVATAKSLGSGFAEGGFTGGGYGTPDQSGHKVAGVVHEGEYVLPKWMVTSPKFSTTIAQLESARVNNGVGYAAGGVVTAPAAGTGSGPDMSVLISMQQQLNTLQMQTNVALEKPSYISPTDFRDYENTRVLINDMFVN